MGQEVFHIVMPVQDGTGLGAEGIASDGWHGSMTMGFYPQANKGLNLSIRFEKVRHKPLPCFLSKKTACRAYFTLIAGWFASASLVNPNRFRRWSTENCHLLTNIVELSTKLKRTGKERHDKLLWLYCTGWATQCG